MDSVALGGNEKVLLECRALMTLNAAATAGQRRFNHSVVFRVFGMASGTSGRWARLLVEFVFRRFAVVLGDIAVFSERYLAAQVRRS